MLTVIYISYYLLVLGRYHLVLDEFRRCNPLGGEALLKHRARYAMEWKSNVN